MNKASKIIANFATITKAEQRLALLKIANMLHNNNEEITIVAEQTIQDVSSADIMIGTESIKLRGLIIPLNNLKIEQRIPLSTFVTQRNIEAEEACVLSYGGQNGQDKSFLTIVSRNLGRKIKIHYAEEALDVIGTHSANSENTLLLSKSNDADCTVIDPCSMRINDAGIYLGDDTELAWESISAMTVQDCLSIAIGRLQMITLSES